MFLSVLLILNSKLYLFALFVIDHESSTCDQVSLCLCLSNKVGRSISGDVMMLLKINEELYFFSIIFLSEILLFEMRFVFLRCDSYLAR
jgi:hypothetical protein